MHPARSPTIESKIQSARAPILGSASMIAPNGAALTVIRRMRSPKPGHDPGKVENKRCTRYLATRLPQSLAGSLL
jgi:hypothetical protein